MVDSESSLRMSLIRFPLIVCVVFVHTYGTTVGLAGNELGVTQISFVSDFVRTIISQGVARVAVPLFFLMSGYLFFVGLIWRVESFSKKLRSRVRTLLIPFLFWNFSILLLLALAQAFPATQIYFSGNKLPIADFGAFDYLSAIIGIDRYPIAYQFWFIRDLMILVLVTPIIFLLNKFVAIPFLLVIFGYWFIGAWPVLAPSSEATLFFSFGAYLASRRLNLFFLDKYGAVITLLYIPLVVIDALPTDKQSGLYWHKVGIVAGVAAALYLTRYVARVEKLKLLVLWLGSASFFVFATHEPLLTVLRKVAYKLTQPDSSSLILGLYFLIPVVVIAFSVMAYRLLSAFAPRFTNLVTGGR